MEEQQLTLEEMLSLAEKVEDLWEIHRDYFRFYDGTGRGWALEGSLKELDIEINSINGLFSDCYSVKIERNNILMGNIKLSEKKEDGKRLKIVYNNALKVVEKKYQNNKKRESENQQKERGDALKYARDLLDK